MAIPKARQKWMGETKVRRKVSWIQKALDLAQMKASRTVRKKQVKHSTHFSGSLCMFLESPN
jgi:hypothetical protein